MIFNSENFSKEWVKLIEPQLSPKAFYVVLLDKWESFNISSLYKAQDSNLVVLL
jgi:hypothetical protein